MMERLRWRAEGKMRPLWRKVWDLLHGRRFAG